MKILLISTLSYNTTQKYSDFGILLRDEPAGHGQCPKRQLSLLQYAVIRILEELLHKTFNITAHITVRKDKYEGWNFNSGNYLFTTDTK